MQSARKAIAILTITFLPFAQAISAPSPEKKQNIIHLMQLSHSLEMGKNLAKVMTRGMAQRYSKDPEKAEKANSIVHEEVSNLMDRHEAELMDLFVDIYDSNFTDDEIKQIIAYYESPIGQKTLRLLPGMMAEVQAGTTRWAAKYSNEVTSTISTRFKAEGLE
ncbi:DUF2059 domain-containing protein [Pseudomonas sp.]|uniref:DUF2059 domain-containing protein n=1 Tax=Pseudomonas sp. TaxID=306 RepID=UPI0002DC6562|nr:MULTISPECIES: DUF2059 domain-containing protein [Pseudomonas]